jgi:hypothetical protein
MDLKGVESFHNGHQGLPLRGENVNVADAQTRLRFWQGTGLSEEGK